MTRTLGRGPWRDAWHRVVHTIHGLMRADEGPRALSLFALLILFLIGINGLNVLNSYVGRDFISAIENRDTRGFLHQAWLYVLVFAALTAAAVLYRYCEERLALLWRGWQTRHLLERYLSHRAFYHLEERGEVQNPDQRISEDVRNFATTSLSFFLMMLNATFTAIAFSGVLWSISPRLFVVAVLYAGAGSVFAFWLGRQLIGLNGQQLDKEAQFRAELLQVGENVESIAVLHREQRVHQRLLQRLDQVLNNSRRMITVNRNLGFFTNWYNYLIQIMPALIVAPLFMNGHVEFGVVTQSAMAFAQLMGAFSLAVTQFQSISTYVAVVQRIDRLAEAVDRADEPQHWPIEVVDTDGRLIFERLTLRDSDGRERVKDLSVSIERGMRVLVASPSGHAKIALFKATAGLYVEGQGRIVRPDAGTLSFVPEQPYLPNGSLRELMLEGAPDGTVSDERILEVLDQLDLGTLARTKGGLDGEHDWTHNIGLSVQARLVLARVLLWRPQFVFLDRLSGVMDLEQIEHTLRLLSQNGTSYLLLGKPNDPLDLFDAVLSIERDGSWSWRLLKT